MNLKGEMSRLTVEFKPGVFIGNINARVRDKLWDKVVKKWCIDALMIYTTNNEQGYLVRSNGETSRSIVEFDGLLLTEHSV
jgi:CRISPR-associated protein Cas2